MELLDLIERQLVIGMRLLMEHQPAAADTRTHAGKPESRAPRGADPDRERDEWGGPVDPESEPLIHWYLWRRGMAGDDRAARRRLVVEAQIRLEDRRRTPADRSVASIAKQKSAASKERDKRIVTEYVGLSPEHVALIESAAGGSVPAANVIRVREAAGLDGRTGRPRDKVERWSKAEKREEARRLRRLGLSYGQIEDRLDTPRSTVQGWTKDVVPDRRREEAA